MGEIVLESAAEGFCRDVEEIAGQYRKDGESISKKYNESIEQAREIKRKAEERYSAEALKHNMKFKGRIEQAAAIRKSKAEHPEQIDKAAQTVITIMGGHGFGFIGGMSEDEARNARRKIENAERERLQAEENEAKYSEIKPGRVW